jgi:molecular chaperone GrpE
MSEEEKDELSRTREGEAVGDASDSDLRAQLEEAQREATQFHALMQRVQADFVNYRRRMEEERTALQERANESLVLRLLPVLDDYERALQFVPAVEEFRPWTAGVELVYRNFRGILESFGVTQIQALGMSFDPMEHESVSYQLSDDHEDGMVMSVVREGYKLYGRVLRPAQVTVSRRNNKAGESPNT